MINELSYYTHIKVSKLDHMSCACDHQLILDLSMDVAVTQDPFALHDRYELSSNLFYLT